MSLTPKQQLEQVNNPNLLSILSTVQGLPSQESLKHGAYVWKKYQYTPAVTFENPQFDLSCSNSTTATIKNANFDLSKIENYIDFFDGLTATTTSTGHDYFIKQSDGTLGLMVASMLIIVTSFDSVTGTFTLNNKATVNRTYVYTGTKNYSDEKKTFLDFVVSDQETAYPDGGEQGGYWYEKFQLDPALFGCTKYAVDKFTLTSDAVASNNYIPHSLGVVPLFALFITTDASANDRYIKYAIIIGGNGNSPNLGLYAYRSMQTNDGYYGVTNIFEDKLRINYDNVSYKAGVEYTLITMA